MHLSPEIYDVLLVLLGAAVGTIGTLIGAGGGFILVPVLIYAWPEESSAVVTSVSLAVVFMNALSGSFAYMRMKRVDFKSGIFFSLATLPGAIIGAHLINYISRANFDLCFGIVLIIISTYLFFRKKVSARKQPQHGKGFERRRTDKYGIEHHYRYNLPMAILLSFFVGFMSSMLGIGGGIIHVPALVSFFNFPVHIATATSHFTLAITALAGTVEHIFDGSLQKKWPEVLLIGAGVVMGAQLGARLAHKVKDSFIIRALAVALGLVGIRILITAFDALHWI